MGQLLSVKPLLAKPLLFHEVHGLGIEISDNKSAARCVKTVDHNLLFSSQPIKVNQKVLIKLFTVSERSHDSISIGFTSHDPSDLRFNLPKCANYELEKRSDFWICTLSKHYCTKNSILHFYFNENGCFQYGNSEKDIRKASATIDKNKPVWAVIHIWSAPTAIMLLDSVTRLENVDTKFFFQNPGRVSAYRYGDKKVVLKDASVCTLPQTEDNAPCTICYENNTEVALFPCGHLCVCYECANMQWKGEGDGKCPMCRVPIQTILKIYKS